MSYDNTNRGVLFINDRKRAGNKPDGTPFKDPDRTGNININGVEYWLDGWAGVGKDGKPYLQLRVKPKQPGGADFKKEPAPPPAAPQEPAFPDDDIPF